MTKEDTKKAENALAALEKLPQLSSSGPEVESARIDESDAEDSIM